MVKTYNVFVETLDTPKRLVKKVVQSKTRITLMEFVRKNIKMDNEKLSNIAWVNGVAPSPATDTRQKLKNAIAKCRWTIKNKK